MLADLRLQNFRSYKDSSFEFSPGVNIIVGPNASGKTNLLEAVLVLSIGKSYRAKDAELMHFNSEWTKLDSHLADNTERIATLKINDKPLKTFKIDDKPIKRLNLNNTIPVVLFEPNHLQLLSVRPEKRRDYIDDLIEQTTSGYGTLRRKYSRVVSQRNSLLKQSAIRENVIFPWNIKISQLAGQIVRERSDMLRKINQDLDRLYKELAGSKTSVSLKYKSQWKEDVYETNLLNELERNLELDKLKGFTSAGPHREDIETTFNNRPAQISASRGETRTLILAIKIKELSILEESRKTKPLLLLDDVFSELDGARRHHLVSYLKSNQVFITTTDADIVSKDFIKQANIIPIN